MRTAGARMLLRGLIQEDAVEDRNGDTEPQQLAPMAGVTDLAFRRLCVGRGI